MVLMRSVLLALLFSASVSAVASEPERLVCISKGEQPLRLAHPDCVSIISNELRVDPDAKVGSVIIVDPDRGILLTSMPAGQSKLPFSLPSLVPVTFALRSSANRLPDQITIALRSESGTTWRWVATSNEARSSRFSVAPGRYDIDVSAAHHERLTIRSFEVPTRAIPLGEKTLKAVPWVRGRIAGPAENGALAKVTDGDDRLLGYADRTGSFAIDVHETWPEILKISTPGYSVQHVELPPTPQYGLNVGTVEISAGGSLHFRISSEAAAPPGTALLMIAQTSRAVGEKAFDGKRRDLLFDNLEPERYVAQIRGPEPFQRFAKLVSVESGSVQDVAFAITPQSIHFTVFLGDKRLARSSIRLQHLDGKWDGTLTTDDNGEATAEFWQTGDFLASITSAEVAVPHVQLVTVSTTDVTFRLPDARVKGVVLESGSDKPLADVEIGLRTEADGMTTSLRTHTDTNGQFEYRAVKPGHHTVSAAASGFITPKSVEFDLTADQSGRDLTILLTRGVSGAIHIVDTSGKPCANAAVAELAGGRFLETRFADESGAMSMTIAEGESRLLVVVPREGSFAIVHVDAQQLVDGSGQGLSVVVPDASAVLDVKTQSDRGDPIPNVVLGLRYNGITLPLEIVQALDRVQSTRFITGVDGAAHLSRIPPGLYEFQPLWSRQEADLALALVRARVEVRPGENVAVLTFTATDRKQ